MKPKDNKALYKHLKILQSQQDANNKILDALWLQYRIDKQYIAQGDYLDQVAAYKRNTETYTVVKAMAEFQPPSGSNYWLTTIERPLKWEL